MGVVLCCASSVVLQELLFLVNEKALIMGTGAHVKIGNVEENSVTCSSSYYDGLTSRGR